MNQRSASNFAVAGFIAFCAILWLFLAYGSGNQTRQEAKATPAKKAKQERPSSADEALYPETVNMLDDSGKLVWVIADEWSDAWRKGYRFPPNDRIELDDGDQRFTMTGKELNAIQSAGRWRLFWKLHGPRRNIAAD